LAIRQFFRGGGFQLGSAEGRPITDPAEQAALEKYRKRETL
jgi:hypothetical protein